MVRLDRRALLKLGCVLAAGCGAEATPDPATPEAKGPPRDADRIAAQAVGARVTALVFMDRVRDHALAPKIATLDAISEAFEGTDVDPVRDVDRAFVAALHAKSQDEAIAVAQHQLPEARVKAAMTHMVQASGGDGLWLTDYPCPTAKVTVRQRRTVVMAATPTLLVVTSPTYARAATALTKSIGLPDPTGPQAVIAHADHPSDSLKVQGAPEVPATVSFVDASVILREDGGADVAVIGESQDAKQAKADAAQLTKDMDAASRVALLGIKKVQVFKPLVFRADGNMLRAKRRVTRTELDALLMIAAMMLG